MDNRDQLFDSVNRWPWTLRAGEDNNSGITICGASEDNKSAIS